MILKNVLKVNETVPKWNPVNTVTIQPKKISRINEGFLQENVSGFC